MTDRLGGPLTARVFHVEHPFIYVEVSAPARNDMGHRWKESIGVALRAGPGCLTKLPDDEEITPPCTIVDVPPPAQQNLMPQIDRWRNEFSQRMKDKTDFTREDEGLWTMDKKMVSLAVAGDILYHENGDRGLGAYIWMRVHFLGSEAPVEDLEGLLVALGYGYFRDEDASNGMFTRKGEAYCYISPEFPEGWSENHALTEGGTGRYSWQG